MGWQAAPSRWRRQLHHRPEVAAGATGSPVRWGPVALEKIVVLRNPVSGRGRHAAAWDSFQAAASVAGLSYDVVETKGPGTARAQVEDLAQAYDVIIAAGGDGTIGDVATGIYGSQAAMAILPLGTGNDLSRMLGLHGKPEEVVKRLKDGTERTIDACRWTCGGHSGLSVNVAGTGFDAAVADRINRGIRSLTGHLAYVAAIVAELRSHGPAEFQLEIDGEKMTTSAMLCSIANSSSYGGGMLIAPPADLSDGLLDLVMVQATGKLRFLQQFPKVFSGKHLGLPEVIHQQVKSVTVRTDPPLPVLADGEVVGRGEVRFEVVPQAIRLRA